jgi:hypothetical protein
LHQRRSAADRDHLEAVIVVEVHVKARENRVEVVMLHLRESVRQLACVVIVDEGNGADDLLVTFPLLANERLPCEVAQRLRAVHVLAAPAQAVEALQELRIHGYAQADRAAHLSNPPSLLNRLLPQARGGGHTGP